VVTIEELLHRRTDLSTFVVHFTRRPVPMGSRSPSHSPAVRASTPCGISTSILARIASG